MNNTTLCLNTHALIIETAYNHRSRPTYHVDANYLIVSFATFFVSENACDVMCLKSKAAFTDFLGFEREGSDCLLANFAETVRLFEWSRGCFTFPTRSHGTINDTSLTSLSQESAVTVMASTKRRDRVCLMV